MPRRPRQKKGGDIRLQDHLVLLHFLVCKEFGCRAPRAMIEKLRDVPPNFDANGESEYARALYLNPEKANVSRAQLVEYDANIAAHSRQLHMTGEHGRTWKPHQYLALLLTERYLHRYFDNPDKLLADLNHMKRVDSPRHIRLLPDYTPDDLRTIAFQSATGSGKTLLMHAHILQYRYYLDRAGGRLNNIVLITPNEQMSAQHERDLRESGLHARIFSSDAKSDLFVPVEIIDLNKLAERKGVKRIAVSDFGDNNLVLVDEGHLGASGQVWRKLRQQLARGGFAFEYSATFNQVSGKYPEMLEIYGKCMLFDYPYSQFHQDGYGKDYAILNLPGGVQDENSNMYLLGCLLSFYQQCCIWRDHGASWADYQLTRPLWVFLGKTVLGPSKEAQTTRSDVVYILNFFGWVLAHGEKVKAMLECLLTGRSGLSNEGGGDYFAGRFPWLPQGDPPALYADLCETLFHGQGHLHVVYLTAGEGELHLRSADGPVFGVVNVGDSSSLYKLLTGAANPDIDLDREAGFAKRLFAHVDRPDSTVNVVVGARRFIAGWNSWRVSTMGLMHVGVREGPEIVQMFGRGVRLKGRDMSLKRHRALGDAPHNGEQLAELEMLRIFGLRADYMQTFRSLLEKEDMHAERTTISLPTTWNFARKTDLKMIRLREDKKYEFSDQRPILPDPPDHAVVERDLYSQLQSEESGTATGSRTPDRQSGPLSHAALFDKDRVYDSLQRRKQRAGWRNLIIKPETVAKLLADDKWYTLYMPPARMRPTTFEQLRAQEDLAVTLIADYAERFWRNQRRHWEYDHIKVDTLGEGDPNHVKEYRCVLCATEVDAIDCLQHLAKDTRGTYYSHAHKVGTLMTPAHAYKPLLCADKGCEITIQPIPLDMHEKLVVENLAKLAEGDDPCLQGRELFLIRNMTRGRGVSFFDNDAYYPDFIVWLKNDEDQHVLFLDPKGLGRFGQRERDKVEWHRKIKDIEKRIQDDAPGLWLHAYVLSVTPAEKIGNGSRRSVEDWEKDGVYFMDHRNFLKKIIQDALPALPPRDELA